MTYTTANIGPYTPCLYRCNCLTIFEAVLPQYIILLSFLVTHASFGSPSASPYVHAGYNTDDHYPLYVDILNTVMVVTACTVCTCVCARTWRTHGRRIVTEIHTYIHKYSDFLVVMISVRLATINSPKLFKSSLNTNTHCIQQHL